MIGFVFAFPVKHAQPQTEVDLEQTLHRWRATLPGWRLRVWSPSRLVEALASLPDEWPMILTADVPGHGAK